VHPALELERRDPRRIIGVQRGRDAQKPVERRVAVDGGHADGSQVLSQLGGSFGEVNGEGARRTAAGRPETFRTGGKGRTDALAGGPKLSRRGLLALGGALPSVARAPERRRRSLIYRNIILQGSGLRPEFS